MKLYHHTTLEAAKNIVSNQKFQKLIDAGMSVDYSKGVWASTHPHGNAAGYGPVAVSFDVSDHGAVLDDEFPNGEKHYVVPSNAGRNFKIHGAVEESKHYATLLDPSSRADYVKRHHSRYPDYKVEKEEKKSKNSVMAQVSMNALIANFNKRLISRLSQVERIIRNQSKQLSVTVDRRVNDIVSLIKKDVLDSYHRSYRLGLESCGLGYRFASKRLVSSNEHKWVDSATRQEMGYFSGLLLDMKAGKPLSKLAVRVQMYGSGLKALYSAGQVSGMSTDTVVDWIVNPSAEHCEDCIFLSNNSPYTPETLPTTPGAGLCRCLSSCKCTLKFRVVGEQTVLKVKVGSRNKETMLRSIQKAQRSRSKPV